MDVDKFLFNVRWGRQILVSTPTRRAITYVNTVIMLLVGVWMLTTLPQVWMLLYLVLVSIPDLINARRWTTDDAVSHSLQAVASQRSASHRS
jgi:hypothetical protein